MSHTAINLTFSMLQFVCNKILTRLIRSTTVMFVATTKGICQLFLMDLLSRVFTPPQHQTVRVAENYFPPLAWHILNRCQSKFSSVANLIGMRSRRCSSSPPIFIFNVFFIFFLRACDSKVTSVKIGMYKQNIHGAHHAMLLVFRSSFVPFLTALFFEGNFFTCSCNRSRNVPST